MNWTWILDEDGDAARAEVLAGNAETFALQLDGRLLLRPRRSCFPTEAAALLARQRDLENQVEELEQLRDEIATRLRSLR